MSESAGHSAGAAARVPAPCPQLWEAACVQCVTCSGLGGRSARCSVRRSVRRRAWPRKVRGVGVKVLGLVSWGLWWVRLCLAGARYPLPAGLHRALGPGPSRLPELVPHWGALVSPTCHLRGGWLRSELTSGSY